jgi:hypothetical protein
MRNKQEIHKPRESGRDPIHLIFFFKAINSAFVCTQFSRNGLELLRSTSIACGGADLSEKLISDDVRDFWRGVACSSRFAGVASNAPTAPKFLRSPSVTLRASVRGYELFKFLRS